MLTNATQQQLASLIHHAPPHSDIVLTDVTIESMIENGVALLISNSEEHHTYKSGSDNNYLTSRLETFSKQLKIIHTLQKNAFSLVFEALKANDIDFIVLKGWALSYTVYQEAHHRPKTDIDILIDAEHKSQVKQLLTQLGYTNPRGWEPSEIIDQFSMRKKIVEGVYANIDVHLKLTNDKVLQPLFPWSELKKTAEFEPVLQAKVLNKPFALIHSVIHMLHHACHGDFIKLIWFYDIKLLIEQLLPEEIIDLQNKVDEMKLGKAIHFTLIETYRLFPAETTHHLIEILSKSKNNNDFDYLTQPPSRLNVMIRNFKKTKGFERKLKIIKETFFPQKEEIYLKYGANSKWPLSILYIRRIITGLYKLLK